MKAADKKPGTDADADLGQPERGINPRERLLSATKQSLRSNLYEFLTQ